MKIRAKESHIIEKFRNKLAKKLSKETTSSNPEVLERIRNTLKLKLSNESDRIPLRERVIPYDKKQNSAKVHSKFVRNLMKQLNPPKEI